MDLEGTWILHHGTSSDSHDWNGVLQILELQWNYEDSGDNSIGNDSVFYMSIRVYGLAL